MKGVPFYEDWFSPRLRRNRISFLLANLTLFIFVFSLLYLFMSFSNSRRSSFFIFVAFWIPFVVCQYFLTGQRLRDFGATGWLALLWVPISLAESSIRLPFGLAFLILLCFVPGSIGTNRYGADPLEE